MIGDPIAEVEQHATPTRRSNLREQLILIVEDPIRCRRIHVGHTPVRAIFTRMRPICGAPRAMAAT
jgi:hypothetical protein